MAKRTDEKIGDIRDYIEKRNSLYVFTCPYCGKGISALDEAQALSNSASHIGAHLGAEGNHDTTNNKGDKRNRPAQKHRVRGPGREDVRPEDRPG